MATYLVSSNVPGNNPFYKYNGYVTVKEFTLGEDDPIWNKPPVVMAVVSTVLPENGMSLISLSHKMLRECPYMTLPSDNKGGIILPLMEWSSEFFARGGQRAYFGPQLEELDPDLPKTFVHFDELSWQILYQYPDFLASEMKSSRDKIQRVLKQYFQIPPEKRHGDAWFTKAMENEMRALGIGDDDIATMMVTIYWG